jgi:hypothetical protein
LRAVPKVTPWISFRLRMTPNSTSSIGASWRPGRLYRLRVIEDEAIIAMDIAAIVEGMGHRVTGTARTHA